MTTNNERENPEGVSGPLKEVLDTLSVVSDGDQPQDFGGTVTVLLGRIQSGDCDAEDQLYQEVINQLVGKARKILHGFHLREGLIEPEELVAEVFEKLRKVLAGHDVKDRQHFFHIACRNFRWKILEILKRRHTDHQLSNDPPEPAVGGTSISSQIAKAELAELVLREIGQLDEIQQRIIQYHVFFDMSLRQIGDVLDCPHTTVAYQYNQIIEHLQHRLRGKG